MEKIIHVKSQVMEFLEDNEIARMMAAETIVNNALTGEFMDPEGEQEMEDNRLETFEQHEDFEHLDPDFIETPDGIFEKSFRPIELRPLE